MRVPLPVGIAAARAAARLSRLVGAGGGTTVPGKVISALDPDALDRLARRLPLGCVLVSATNGKTTTAAMATEILSPRVRLARNGSGANLVSGVTSALLAAKGAELGLFEVDEAALPEIARRAQPEGRLPRKPVPRPARPLRRARAPRRAVAGEWRRSCRQTPCWWQTGTIRRSPTSRCERASAIVFGLDDPRHAVRELQHAADSKWCLRCGQPYEYEAAYVGHLGEYRCPGCGHGRPKLDVVGPGRRAARAGRRQLQARRSGRRAARRAVRAGPLQRVQRARGRVARDRARNAARGREVRPGAVRRSLRALRANRRRRSQALAAPRQEPGRRQRSGPHARRRRRSDAGGARPQRRDRGRPGRLLDLGRRLGAACWRASSA